jgi:CheY-like chemotaxis protein
MSSTLGKGSLFSISLPAAADQCGTKPPCQSALCNCGGRILVMDDEENIRTIAKAILEEFGFTVELAKDGVEAVRLFRRSKEEGAPFSAVILDLTIPGGVGGKEAIKKLRKMDPEIKAIVSSGYSNDPVMASYREHGFSAVLSKPYRPKDLSEVLRKLLGS